MEKDICEGGRWSFGIFLMNFIILVFIFVIEVLGMIVFCSLGGWEVVLVEWFFLKFVDIFSFRIM